MADPVVLSEEPGSVTIKVQDPTKPKVTKLPPKLTTKDKVIQAFFGNEVTTSNIGEHILKDYAEPTAKRMLNGVVQGLLKKLGDATQMLLFGKVINSSGPVDYTSYSNPAVSAPVAHKLADQVEQFAFSTRQDAVNVLEYLKGKIREYGSASVLDYYEAVSEPVDYMMSNRGWLDLSTATIKVAPEGFVIDLPRPIVLKRG